MPQPGAHPRGQLLNIHQLTMAWDIPLPGEGGGKTFQSLPRKLWTGCEGTGLVTQMPLGSLRPGQQDGRSSGQWPWDLVSHRALGDGQRLRAAHRFGRGGHREGLSLNPWKPQACWSRPKLEQPSGGTAGGECDYGQVAHPPLHTTLFRPGGNLV